MNLQIINRAIREICTEVTAISESTADWRVLTEEQLLYEAAVCMFSSQMVFEIAEAMAQKILECGLLRCHCHSVEIRDYESQVVSVLSEPLTVMDSKGNIRLVRPRFKNRLASLLASTVQDIYGQGASIYKKLSIAKSSRHAREVLVDSIWGFGPKQASLFLRRIGYCSELAVLDTHVLDYLRLARGLDTKPTALSRLSAYERLEAEFQDVALEFGHSVGCVDLATWVTMRVAKREAILWA